MAGLDFIINDSCGAQPACENHEQQQPSLPPDGSPPSSSGPVGTECTASCWHIAPPPAPLSCTSRMFTAEEVTAADEMIMERAEDYLDDAAAAAPLSSSEDGGLLLQSSLPVTDARYAVAAEHQHTTSLPETTIAVAALERNVTRFAYAPVLLMSPRGGASSSTASRRPNNRATTTNSSIAPPPPVVAPFGTPPNFDCCCEQDNNNPTTNLFSTGLRSFQRTLVRNNGQSSASGTAALHLRSEDHVTVRRDDESSSPMGGGVSATAAAIGSSEWSTSSRRPLIPSCAAPPYFAPAIHTSGGVTAGSVRGYSCSLKEAAAATSRKRSSTLQHALIRRFESKADDDDVTYFPACAAITPRYSPSSPFLSSRRKQPASRSTSRQRQFAVVEIALGQCKKHYIHTPDLLRLVHTHNHEGRVQDGEAGSLKLRDLRQICSQSLGGQRASIELRRNCVLFNMCGVRCIIMHEKIILIPRGFNNHSRGLSVGHRQSYNSLLSQQAEHAAHLLSAAVVPFDSEEDALIQKLIKITGLRSTVGGHFEFAVLESLLVEVCSFLTDELSPIIQEADLMRDLTAGRLSSVLRLHEIGEFKRRLDSLCDRLRNASQAIQELLDNEEDVRRLELTRFWLCPGEWENPKDTPASEDAEMLLECYEQELESMLRQATRIDESLDDALQIVQLRLASIRNAFLKSELGLDIVGTVVGCVGAIAGIFGMNVPNGWEDNRAVFWPMTQAMLLVCAITAILVILMFRRVQL